MNNKREEEITSWMIERSTILRRSIKFTKVMLIESSEKSASLIIGCNIYQQMYIFFYYFIALCLQNIWINYQNDRYNYDINSNFQTDNKLLTDVSPTHIFYGQVCKKKFNILLIRITDDTRFGLQVHVQLQANKKESMSIVLFELR